MNTMKGIMKSVLALTALVAFSMNVNAQGVFEVSNTVCDLGTVQAGDDATCEITFKNTGTSKANMGAISPASDRITHDWSSKILAPGESDSFKIVVDTDGLSGEFKKSVLLIFDRAKDPITVWVKGNIE
ncbi:MAG: hypothetical protein ACI9P8_000372 [Bacteroidia bacterium]|jgi:hypothetical protein